MRAGVLGNVLICFASACIHLLSAISSIEANEVVSAWPDGISTGEATTGEVWYILSLCRYAVVGLPM